MGWLFKGFAKKGDWYFRNTKTDYIIFFASLIVFLQAFLTMKHIAIYSIYWQEYNVTIGYGTEVGIQFFIAPIIAIHRVMIMIIGEYRMKRARALFLGFRIKIGIIYLKYKFKNKIINMTKNELILTLVLWSISLIIWGWILQQIIC